MQDTAYLKNRRIQLIDFKNFAFFVAASWVLIITPGPDIIYVLSRGISQGRRAGIISAVGVTTGILVQKIH